MEGVGSVPARSDHTQQAERAKDLKADDYRKGVHRALRVLGLVAKAISPRRYTLLKQSEAEAISFLGYNSHMTDG